MSKRELRKIAREIKEIKAQLNKVSMVDLDAFAKKHKLKRDKIFGDEVYQSDTRGFRQMKLRNGDINTYFVDIYPSLKPDSISFSIHMDCMEADVQQEFPMSAFKSERDILKFIDSSIKELHEIANENC